MKPLSLIVCKLIALSLILAGCASVTYEYKSVPESQHLTTDLVKVAFTPERHRANYYSTFLLRVENLSAVPIEIDWNRTAYIRNGKNAGPFVWEGIDPNQIKSKTLPGTRILPGQIFSKSISPLTKVALAQRTQKTAGKDSPGLYAGILPAGENGIRLATIANGKPVFNTLSIVITEEQK